MASFPNPIILAAVRSPRPCQVLPVPFSQGEGGEPSSGRTLSKRIPSELMKGERPIRMVTVLSAAADMAWSGWVVPPPQGYGASSTYVVEVTARISLSSNGVSMEDDTYGGCHIPAGANIMETFGEC